MSQFLKIKTIEPHYDLPSAFSNRKHMVFVLPNGLKCLLIHDSSSEMVCGAMSVNCGAFSDPQNALGLAHLTEHMITRGSKTFRPPFSLGQSLFSAGGQLNAYTTSDQTSFYFEVSNFAEDIIFGGTSIVESILPVFSSMLSSPLLSKKYIRPEIKAVDDEHCGNKTDEEKLIFHTFRLLANSKHSFSQFATGNHETLSEASSKKMKKMMKAYFNRNFLPKNMALVLKGPQTLLLLKKLVMMNFQDMLEPYPQESATNPAAHSARECPLFDKEDANMIIVKGPFTPKIRVCFPVYLVEKMENYKAAIRTLCKLLGEESPQSLSSILNTQKKWVDSLFVFTQKMFSNVELLIVELIPTHLAWSHITEITNEIISYSRENIGDSDEIALRALIDHFASIEEFNHKSQVPSPSLLDEVLDYAERLNRSPAGVMQASFITDFEPWKDLSNASKTLKTIIEACFTDETVKLQILISDNMSIGQLVPEEILTDRFFHFQYALSRFRSRPRHISIKDKKLPSPKSTLAKQLLFKVSHPFITTTRFKVRDMYLQPDVPQLTNYDHCSELWNFLSSDLADRRLDDSIVTTYLKFPQMEANATNFVAVDLLIELVGDELRSSLYEYEKIGCFWGLFANINRKNSIMVTASGPQFAVEHIIAQSFTKIRKLIGAIHLIPYPQLKRARVALRKKYDEQSKSHNMKKVLSVVYLLMEERLTTPMQKIEALELIDSTTLESFGYQLSHYQPYRSFLTYGHLNRDFCKNNAYIGVEGAKKPEVRELSSLVLRKGCFYSYETFVSEDDNLSIVMHYTQIGLRTEIELFALAKFYVYLLNTTAIEEMRIKRQLSYCVYTGLRMFQRTFGIYLLIPSAWNDCECITNQIEDFLQVVDDMISICTEEEFRTKLVSPFLESIDRETIDNSGTSLFADLQPQRGSGRKPTTPKFNAHWNHLNQILNSTYSFESKNCEECLDLKSIKQLTKKEYLSFIHKHMCVESSTRSVLVVCSHPVEGADLRKRKLVAQYLVQKLEKLGLAIDNTQVYDALLNCQDQTSYSDVLKVILVIFKYKEQRVKLRKLQLESKISGLLTNMLACLSRIVLLKSDKSHRRVSAIPMIRCSDYHQIQNECSIAEPVSLSDKFLKLTSIEENQNNF